MLTSTVAAKLPLTNGIRAIAIPAQKPCVYFLDLILDLLFGNAYDLVIHSWSIKTDGFRTIPPFPPEHVSVPTFSALKNALLDRASGEPASLARTIRPECHGK